MVWGCPRLPFSTWNGSATRASLAARACTPLSCVRDGSPSRLEGEAAWERIWTGLAAAGIDARDDFKYRGPSPYPGLRAYDEDDAAVFSGRGPEIAEALALIEQLHGGESAALVVVGASGSGKSSLVRAGIVPRLRKDEARWFVIGPMRLRGDPRGVLDRALAIAQPELGLAAPGGPRSAEELVAALGACCAAARRDPAHRDRAVLLVLDQMEEVFSLPPPDRGRAVSRPRRSRARRFGRLAVRARDHPDAVSPSASDRAAVEGTALADDVAWTAAGVATHRGGRAPCHRRGHRLGTRPRRANRPPGADERRAPAPVVRAGPDVRRQRAGALRGCKPGLSRYPASSRTTVSKSSRSGTRRERAGPGCSTPSSKTWCGPSAPRSAQIHGALP